MKLEHLSPYLPYGLKMKSPHGFRPNGKESTGTSGIVFLTGDLYADIENNTFKGEKFKPILRPLSDLTKEIEHNGKKFVPIVELAKKGTREDSCYITNSNFGTCYVNSEYTKKGFFIYHNNGYFIWQVGKNAEEKTVYNQFYLFQKLFEWHFDVFNLREKDLCIYYDELK